MNIQMISTDLIFPNTYNPNEMTEEEFNELKTEVKRVGKPPKPIVVRPNGGKYQIVDGEHGWRAAKELGLPEVPCEVADIDDFEARRQTFKRNCHGQNDPLKLGLMFLDMLETGKLSIRKLAKKIDVPESTIRNYVAYVKALKLRSSYAVKMHELIKAHFGEANGKRPTPEAEIRRLTIRQVRIYLSLPEAVRNTWLDAGAPIAAVEKYRGHDSDSPFGRLRELVKADLACGLSSQDAEFSKSLRHTLACLDWLEHHTSIENVTDYVRSVARWKLPLEVLQELPVDRRGKTRRVLMSWEAWEQICEDAGVGLMIGEAYTRDLAKGRIEEALREAGVDLDLMRRPYEVEQMEKVRAGPDFIRDADHLALAEKLALIEYTADAPDEILLSAKRQACDHFKAIGKSDSRGLVGIRRLVQDCLCELWEQHCQDQVVSYASTPDTARQIILRKLADVENLPACVDHDVTPRDVIQRRLEQLEGPELAVIAGLLTPPRKSLEGIAEIWIRAAAASPRADQPIEAGTQD